MSNPDLSPSVQREIERLGRKFGTLNLVDQLINENEILRRELNATTSRLRELQIAVHHYLCGDRTNTTESDLAKLAEEK